MFHGVIELAQFFKHDGVDDFTKMICKWHQRFCMLTWKVTFADWRQRRLPGIVCCPCVTQQCEYLGQECRAHCHDCRADCGHWCLLMQWWHYSHRRSAVYCEHRSAPLSDTQIHTCTQTHMHRRMHAAYEEFLIPEVYSVWTKYMVYERSTRSMNQVHGVWTKYTECMNEVVS